MSRRKKEKQPIARCIFCDRPGVDHAHIWPKWVRALFKGHGSRVQSVAPTGPIGQLVYAHKAFEGGVQTKSARRVCPPCNRGWMRDIDLAAEEVGTQLIEGKQVHLYKKDQAALAAFIALAALLIDLLGRIGHRIPQRDYDYFYANKMPAPHWYVGIGHFQDFPRVSVDLSPSDSSTGDKVTAHSVSTTIGALFTATQFFNPPGPPAAIAWPIQINRPHLTPIWPYLNEPILFPSPLFPISGGLWQDGGLARDLSRRFPRIAYDFLSRANTP